MKYSNYKKAFILLIIFFSLENCVSFGTTENPGGESGLVSNYFRDRLMDFRDIMSVTDPIGVVGGAKAQVGPIGVGLYLEPGAAGHGDFTDEYGLKNGEFAKQDTEEIVLLFGSSSSSVDLSAEGSKRAEKRKKNYESALSHLPAYTRLGFAIAIFSGVKLEVNPGELLDFVLGIVLIDIYRDDVYLRNTGRKGK